MTIAGRYRLERSLARGGMAEVWAAQHEGLRSSVAIKFVDAALASDARTAPYALERFRFEAQISAKISAKTHHVVAVHDAGEQDGVPYLVMELINGHTLEDEIERRGPMTPERFADVLDQVADARSARELAVVFRALTARRRSSAKVLPLLVASAILVVALVVFFALRGPEVAALPAPPLPSASLILAPPPPSVAPLSIPSATPHVISTSRPSPAASAPASAVKVVSLRSQVGAVFGQR